MMLQEHLHQYPKWQGLEQRVIHQTKEVVHPDNLEIVPPEIKTKEEEPNETKNTLNTNPNA